MFELYPADCADTSSNADSKRAAGLDGRSEYPAYRHGRQLREEFPLAAIQVKRLVKKRQQRAPCKTSFLPGREFHRARRAIF